jgi:CDP-glucose 4,6-dehydratase
MSATAAAVSSRRLPDPAFWRGRRVLVTGHTGFKGAWLTVWLQHMGAEVLGYSWPALEGGVFDRVRGSLTIADVQGDIRDTDVVRKLAEEFQPHSVLHLAAQPIVGLSYQNPVETFSINVVGTVSVLDAVRHAHGLEGVVVVTSDKVYRNDGSGTPLVESSPLGGHDPYSGSKSASEVATDSMRASYFDEMDIPIVTGRAGNVIGGGDRHMDRIVPDAIDAALHGRTLVLRRPNSTRPWQHVLEPLSGYLVYAEAITRGKSVAPPALNFGPDPLTVRDTVAELVDELYGLMGVGSWEAAASAPFAEAPLLALDSSLAARSLGWAPALTAREALALTWEWEAAAQSDGDLYALTVGQIDAYCSQS